jgi:hypothetical protein
MILSLPDSIKKIFGEVKSLTGKEVQLIEKQDLDTYASIKIARKSMSAHLMYYKSEHTGIINHLIAHECGHILRVYGVEPQYRLVPYSNDQLKLKSLKDIEPDIQKLSQLVPFEKLAQIANLWYSGMVKQLTNFPSDIWIEKWIYDKYPDLRPFQALYMKKQYDEAVQALSSRVEQMTPKKLLNASNGMNYAFFNILGKHFNDNYYLRKYDRSAYVDIGKRLVLLQQESEDSYKGDLDIVNKWAETLHLSHWFAWKDFEDVPDNYLKTFI